MHFSLVSVLMQCGGFCRSKVLSYIYCRLKALVLVRLVVLNWGHLATSGGTSGCYSWDGGATAILGVRDAAKYPSVQKSI